MNTDNQSLPCPSAWRIAFCLGVLAFASFSLFAQDEDVGDVYELSPFTVDGGEDEGYRATSTLAGTRIRTDLKDVGSAISVITEQFLQDTAATDNESLLIYTTNTEAGGVNGTYLGTSSNNGDEGPNIQRPNNANRVRGLTSADNTRGFFLTDIPWDGYAVDRVDLQRGPNAILFGIGSPAGIINANLVTAAFDNSNKVEFRIGSHGSTRASINLNRELLDNELAIRVAALRDDEEFRQDPAFEKDERVYAAINYEPKFLKSDKARTSLKANFETGDITSNRPRMQAPEDLITPWFTEANQGTYNMADAWATNGVLDGGGSGFEPSVGQLFGGPQVYFPEPSSPASFLVTVSEIQMTDNGALGPDGAVDNGFSSFPFQRMVQIRSYPDFAQNANLQFSDTLNPYRKQSLTDRSIFDFKNNLIDGPTKNEWREFDAYNLSLSQTFLGDRLGFEISIDEQDYEDGRESHMNGGAITVDLNTHLADGSPNPNVGRPVIFNRANGGNQSRVTNRSGQRLTGFGIIDFRDTMKSDSFLARLLGKHTFTALLSEQDNDTEDRVWRRYATDNAFGSAIGYPNTGSAEREIVLFSYLGESLLGASSPVGANLSRIMSNQVPTSGSIRYFDTTWTAGSIDPGADWDDNGTLRTQSENPANYVGWTNGSFGILDSANGGRLDLMRTAFLERDEIESEAFIWQGSIWDGLLVPTYGYRDDTASNFKASAPPQAITGVANVLDPSYTLDGVDPVVVSGISESWSFVLHTDKILPDLPGDTRVSLFYNESENFQPLPGRVDTFGDPIGNPSGSTKDYGFMVSALQDRINLRVNFYESSVKDATFNPGNLWFLGAVETRAWVAAKKFEAGLSGDPAYSGPSYNYGTGSGDGFVQTEADRALQQQHVDAVLSNVAPDSFWSAWGASKSDQRWQSNWWDPWAEPGGSEPQGHTSTADLTSEGVEIELMLRPTDNWDIFFNASRAESVNSNVAGTLIDWVEERNAIWNGLAGDIRMWSGTGGGSIKQQWNSTFYSRYLLATQKDGTNVDEIREWRFNLISNYRFNEGRFKGMNVGGSFRWEDSVSLGYPVFNDSNGNDIFDIANPHMGPSETHVDLWAGYQKKLSDKVDWRIQLNLRDAFASDDLIPVSVQWDGSPGEYRIAPSTRWTLTNTFEF